jgi:cold shock CspA family protein
MVVASKDGHEFGIRVGDMAKSVIFRYSVEDSVDFTPIQIGQTVEFDVALDLQGLYAIQVEIVGMNGMDVIPRSTHNSKPISVTHQTILRQMFHLVA